MFYIRQSNYGALFFAVLLVALVVRSGMLYHEEAEQQEEQTVQQAKAVKAQQLGNFVSGAIGIQEKRGDAVHVYVK